MILRESWDPGLFDEEPKKTITSVGVLIHTGLLNPESNPSFLMIERNNQEGWSIPAGGVEVCDKNPLDTGVRETREEIGLEIDPNKLKSFIVVSKINDLSKVRMVYSHSCSFSKLMTLGTFKYREGLWVTEDVSISQEVKRLALVPRFKMYERNNPVINNFFKWEVSHWIKARLEGLKVI